MVKAAEQPSTAADTPVTPRVGAFRYLTADQRWEWSEAVAAMHGYLPGQVQPTTELVLAHLHPEDAPTVAELVARMAGASGPFSSRHRIIAAPQAANTWCWWSETASPAATARRSAPAASTWTSPTPTTAAASGRR
ncbi:PAS domain-containing protein [Mycolicibacterium tokaiense]|uniref:RNA-binding protein with PAS domain n=1 Tax=Mycolicibacterium tokaiense TaxID=39695 RepID=A0A378T8A3_9MYCO|nr:PAS domain-containing protein [Mycolicibacterium tokaiense]BBY88479.1 hypothetical protein MTOK_42610 [Mycolicibacterium tokaiense]STZ56999.1 RNA-binding protein with PAS domain [Mycolicibacterium tokaiense]